MTDMGLHCMVDDPHLLARRLSAFVRPRGTAKELSAMIGCDIRTAENIREGHWPIARHWLGIFRAFGDDAIEAVFHPEQAVARLEQEVRELEQAAAKKRADLAVLQGPGLDVAQARAAYEDRTYAIDEELFAPRRRPD
jgi:hypothetical protein